MRNNFRDITDVVVIADRNGIPVSDNADLPTTLASVHAQLSARATTFKDDLKQLKRIAKKLGTTVSGDEATEADEIGHRAVNGDASAEAG